MSFNNNANIKIVPVASPVYSAGLYALGALPLISVRIEGLSSPVAHHVNINVYGLSKAGFFMERTTAFSGEVFAEKDKDCIGFNLTGVSYRIKNEFFRTLKSPSAGKISVEVTIDGEKFMGEAPIVLFPSKVYPATASPAIISTFLSPFCRDVARINAKAKSANLSCLYDAVRSERIIYSVRECDFTSRNVPFDDIGTFYAGRSKMASPLEMSLIFCSCALNMGLSPVIVTLKGKKAPVILCGATEKSGIFGTVCSCTEKIRSLAAQGTLELFDISCLFTGHSIELEDAIRVATEELFRSEMVFALDIASSYADGAKLCHFDRENEEAENRFTEAIRQKPSKAEKVKTLSDHAEHLTDTSASPLIGISHENTDFIGVNASGFEAVMKAAHSGELLPLSELFADAARTSGMGEMYEVCRRLRLKNSEIYLVCGFVSHKGNIAPVALYPITLFCKNASVSVKINSPKPYCNRLLCETLKSIPSCRAFFNKIGVPGGDLEDMLSCFEALCAVAHPDLKLIKQCGVGNFPYRNSVISFSIVDKFEKINSDALSLSILSGTKTAETENTVPYGKTACDIELRSPCIFPGAVLDAASHASCGDVFVNNAVGETASDISLAIAGENIRTGKTTLIISQNPSERKEIAEKFDKIGLSNAYLALSGDTDIKNSISEKLTSLSEAVLPKKPESGKDELVKLQEKLGAYARSKSKTYDFDFSFNNAARTYINTGKGLSPEQKALHIEPEAIFFPDLSKSGCQELFIAQVKLCRTACELPRMPYKENPFFKAGITDKATDTAAIRSLSESSLCELAELAVSCMEIAESSGFKLSHIKTLPALHAFLSLLVLISKEYDSGITSALLSRDAYSVSKKLSELRGIARNINELEKELCEFDREVYNLDAAQLISEWNDGETRHSDISKTINAYRTSQAEDGKDKKSVFDALGILCSHRELSAEFEEQSCDMSEVFAGYWNGTGTNWEKVCSIVDFTKMADVLLKKIYGSDTEKRREATNSFPTLAIFCSNAASVSSVIGTASLFDRMFSDGASTLTLASKLSADLYNMSFENGIFGEKGITDTVKGWGESADMLPIIARYNKCTAHCKALGLTSFVHYLENNACTPETEKIFTRSLLFLALKQITLYDKNFLSMNLFEDDMENYRALLAELCEYNAGELAHRHVDLCVAYIKANPTRAKAFSECLSDKNFTPEELLLRNSETVKTLFPVIIADPSYASLAGDVENIIVCSADTLDTSAVLPVLHYGRHRTVISTSEKLSAVSESFAADCKKAGLLEISASAPDVCSLPTPPNVEYLRSPVSSYDKERNTNVLEAQTVGLEIMKTLSAHPEYKIKVLTLTENQIEAVYDVLSAVSEKSVAVQRALLEDRISVSCAMNNTAGSCDVLFISCVFDKDESSGMCMSCRENDKPENAIFHLPIPAFRALCGNAKRTVAVFSFAPSKYPNPVGAPGAARFALFAEYALCGGSFLIPEDTRYSEYTSEFISLMSASGFKTYTVNSGNIPAVCIGGRYYAAIIDDSGIAPVYNACVAVKCGATPIFIDSCELLLNPNKVIDRINSIGKGESI